LSGDIVCPGFGDAFLASDNHRVKPIAADFVVLPAFVMIMAAVATTIRPSRREGATVPDAMTGMGHWRQLLYLPGLAVLRLKAEIQTRHYASDHSYLWRYCL
jgi:hypothetical protein